MIEKISFFGELNQSKDTLNRTSDKFKMLWNDGVYRLLPDDIEYIEKTIREMRGNLATIKSISDLFKKGNNQSPTEKWERGVKN